MTTIDIPDDIFFIYNMEARPYSNGVATNYVGIFLILCKELKYEKCGYSGSGCGGRICPQHCFAMLVPLRSFGLCSPHRRSPARLSLVVNLLFS